MPEPQTMILATAPIRAQLFATAGPPALHGGEALPWPTVRALAVVLPDRLPSNDADAAGKLLAVCAVVEAVIAKRRGNTTRITWQAIPLPDPDTIAPTFVFSLLETSGDGDHLLAYLERHRRGLERHRRGLECPHFTASPPREPGSLSICDRCGAAFA